MSLKYRIAVIPGDGIGVEVMPEGLRVLDAAAKRFGIEPDGARCSSSAASSTSTSTCVPRVCSTACRRRSRTARPAISTS